ncbi:MAG: flavin reductase family protein [Hyphomicrobiales bacterium]
MNKKGEEKAAIAPEHFTAAMARAATGVSIVTTDGSAGKLGMTVSAFSSVSAEPPLLLVCINRRSPLVEAIGENAVFCVNLLHTGHRRLADRFAGRESSGEPYVFDNGVWRREFTGAPVLPGAVAHFDCSLASVHDAGSHRIFIGQVLHIESTENKPLVYTAREYQQITQLQELEG